MKWNLRLIPGYNLCKNWMYFLIKNSPKEDSKSAEELVGLSIVDVSNKHSPNFLSPTHHLQKSNNVLNAAGVTPISIDVTTKLNQDCRVQQFYAVKKKLYFAI